MKQLLFIIISLLALVACNDGDTFSTSASNLLTLAVDTVKMDTVFAHVPVPTKEFWIYNNSSDGIRCSNVRLERGNQSGFRVNVDGIYLGEQSGYQTNGIEVRKGDSIHVFVELTSPENGSALYKKVEDNIIFTLESGKQQVVNLNAVSWSIEKITNLEIKKDTTIDTNVTGKAFVLYGNGITVDSLKTLTIAPGSTIYFHDEAGINVKGKLICKGTAEKNITLRCDRLDNMFKQQPFDDVPGRWQGIHFNEGSYGNEIEYTDIHGGTNGVVCDSSNVSKKVLTMTSSTINNCNGYGLEINNSNVYVANSQISNTQYACVYVNGGDVTLLHNTIAQLYSINGNGIALYFDNSNYPLKNFDVKNCLVTGTAADVINTNFDDEKDCNYQFKDCMLRTPEVTDAPYVDHFEDIIWENKEDTSCCGKNNFVKVDTIYMQSDLHLSEVSKANGAGNAKWMLKLNRDGVARDEKKVNLGCY